MSPLALTSFLNLLRERGFSVSIEHHLAAARLLAALPEGADPRRLKTLLAPVVCTSPDEQRRFREVFEAWTPVSAPPVPAPVPHRDQLKKLVKRANRVDRLLRVLAVAAGLGLFSTGVTQCGPMLYRFVSNALAHPPGPGPGPGSDPIPSTPDQRPAPAAPDRTRWVVVGLLGLATAGLLARLVLRGSLTRKTVTGPVQLGRVDLRRAVDVLLPTLPWVRAGRRLREHRSAGRDRLDPTATAVATANQGGVLTTRYRDRLTQPEYLCLVDTRSSRDQAAELAWTIVQRTGIHALVFAFDGDARRCRRVGRHGERSLDSLARRYSDLRLLIFSDGDRFVDRRRGGLAAWTDAFSAWRERALLTTRTTEQWGAHERALASSGFHLVPLALADVGELRFVRVGRPRPARRETLAALGPFPPLLADGATRWREAIAPTRREQLDLAHQLRTYLGPEVYRWLCATAVFPELHFGLTMFLGAGLRDSAAGPAGCAGGLLRLFGLPWFRHGSMPHWLRFHLLGDLPPGDARATRRLIWDWLASEVAAGTPGGDILAIARRPLREVLVGRWIRKAKPDHPLREQLFYGFLTNSPWQRGRFILNRKLEATFAALHGPRAWWQLALSATAWMVFLWVVLASAVFPQLDGMELPGAEILGTALSVATAGAALLNVREWWLRVTGSRPVRWSGVVASLETAQEVLPVAAARRSAVVRAVSRWMAYVFLREGPRALLARLTTERFLRNLLVVSSTLLGAFLAVTSPRGDKPLAMEAALYFAALTVVLVRRLSRGLEFWEPAGEARP